MFELVWKQPWVVTTEKYKKNILKASRRRRTHWKSLIPNNIVFLLIYDFFFEKEEKSIFHRRNEKQEYENFATGKLFCVCHSSD